MSIFNATAPSGGGGDYKISEYTTSPGYTGVQSLSFTVDGSPKKWSLVGVFTGSVYMRTYSTSVYYITGAQGDTSDDSHVAAYLRYQSSYAGWYATGSYPTTSYSNNTFTLTGSSSYLFIAANTDFSKGVKWQLFYTV